MDAWVDGDLAGEFERQLDDLLAELHSDWVEPELPPRYASNESFRRYHRRNGKRWQLACVLRERPDLAAALAGRVLAAVVCDEHVAANRQLIEPMVTAVGRRRVQEYLISVVTSGSLPQRVCAVRAWYWSQAVLVYESPEALARRQPTTVSQGHNDDVVDLRAWYRACHSLGRPEPGLTSVRWVESVRPVAGRIESPPSSSASALPRATR
ncbi:hypothetical protein ACQPWW_04125 [Micromonospora sp. CA-240977]|uniref:hypothetical protein n=1 Tax=Micromonospora sp. CA-240977 TaxID=3239957 RepID=UPI003D9477F8